MVEDGILVAEQSLTRQLKRSHDLQHSTLVLIGLDRRLERSNLIRSVGWSCQLSFRFLQKSELEGDGYRVNHAEERPLLPTVPRGVIILGMKTQG